MHDQFRDFRSRLWIMGDYAESAFKEYAAQHAMTVLHFGMNRPPFAYFPQLPPLIRGMPDFLVETGLERFASLFRKQAGDTSRTAIPRHGFVEVKGCGRDGQFKLKEEQLDALRTWQRLAARPVLFFLYDQPSDQVSFSLSLDALDALVPTLARGSFLDSGKQRPYVVLPVTHAALTWEPRPTPHAGSSTSMAALSTPTATSSRV